MRRTVCWSPIWSAGFEHLGLEHVVVADNTADSVLLAFTEEGDKLHPRDPDLRARLEQVSMVLTRQTTMWKAWVGFNASHSYGALLFGAVYGYWPSCTALVIAGAQ